MIFSVKVTDNAEYYLEIEAETPSEMKKILKKRLNDFDHDHSVVSSDVIAGIKVGTLKETYDINEPNRKG